MGVLKPGEERAGRGKEIQKGKRSLFITAYHPVKNTNPATFLYARKRKFVLGLKKKKKQHIKFR